MGVKVITILLEGGGGRRSKSLPPSLNRVKNIQKLEILYEFDVRFHTKVRKSNLSCFSDCTKHTSAGALIHRQTIHCFYTNKTKQHLQALTYWALMKRQVLLTIRAAKLKFAIILFLLFGREDTGTILPSAWLEEENFEVQKRCYIQFPYNARSDWNSVFYQRIEKGLMTLSWLSNFCFRISTNLTPIKHPLCDSDNININELFVSSKYGSWRPSLTTVV